MSYFRHTFSSYEEFQQVGLSSGVLGKEELEILDDLAAADGEREDWPCWESSVSRRRQARRAG